MEIHLGKEGAQAVWRGQGIAGNAEGGTEQDALREGANAGYLAGPFRQENLSCP